ncbi:MAG: MFS transporter [Chloroflexi bacterium]|nr:MFS transporter [Chloroflexota bacterium]MBV9596564.1 MFS transporter [Chloroflexota bacterium]
MCAICGIATHIPDTSVPSAAPVDRTRFAALRNADCRNYIAGASLSMGGDSIEHVISYWVMYQQFHSPALAGFAVISHWVPALFSVYFGAWADRSDCRKIIQLAQLLYMSVSATWGLLFLTNSLQVWHCLVLLSVHGLAGAIWAPAEQLMLHDLAGREQLPSAVRLNSTGRSTGFLAGPALGSVMLLVLGPSVGIFANIFMYLPMTIWLARTRYTGHLRDAAGPRPSRVAPLEAIQVLREATSQPVLISMVLLGGLSSFLIGSGIQPQMPEFAIDLGMNQAGLGYGLLLAANSAGAVLGGILLESTHWLKPTLRVAMISTLVWSGCLLGFAFSQQYGVALALLIGAGMANLASQATAQTLVQLMAPAEKRGRIVGVYTMASNGLRAGSGLTIGLAGGLIGIHWSLALSALMLAVVVVVLLWATQRLVAASRVTVAQRFA